jgi:hypothetical protein
MDQKSNKEMKRDKKKQAHVILSVADPEKMLTGGMSFEWGHFFSKFENFSKFL